MKAVESKGERERIINDERSEENENIQKTISLNDL